MYFIWHVCFVIEDATECGALLRLCALGDVAFAVDAAEAGLTLTRVAVHEVRAGSPVPAGGARALVHLHLTAFGGETRPALTGEPAHLVYARAPVDTGVCKKDAEV